MTNPRFPTVARAFNDRVKGYVATVKASWSSTDRQLAGTRLVHHGKGRKGFEITIKNALGEMVYSYDTSASSFRTNGEATRAIERIWGPVWIAGAKLNRIRCFKCKTVENEKTRGRFRSTIVVSGVLVCMKCSEKG